MEQCSFIAGGRVLWWHLCFWWSRLPPLSSLTPVQWLASWRQLQNQSNILKLASRIFPFSSTWICNFSTSRPAGAPTNPVLIFLDVLLRDPHVSRIFIMINNFVIELGLSWQLLGWKAGLWSNWADDPASGGWLQPAPFCGLADLFF